MEIKAEGMTVSAVVPVFNAERTLSASLDSICAQTGVCLEVICIDDGSTDDSRKILEQWAEKDGRVKVLSQQNKGAGAARNAGMRIATGDFVAFIDPDDVLPSECVYAKMVQNALVNQVDVVGGGMVAVNRVTGEPVAIEGCSFDKEGIISFRDYQFAGFFTRFIYSRRFLEEAGICFPDYKRYQDPPFLMRVLDRCGSFYAMVEPVYQYAAGDHVVWTAEKVLDYCKGMRDVLDFAKDNGYGLLYERTVSGLYGGTLLYEASLLDGDRASTLTALRDVCDSVDEAMLGNPSPLAKFERELRTAEGILAARPYRIEKWAKGKLIRKKHIDCLKSLAKKCIQFVARCK